MKRVLMFKSGGQERQAEVRGILMIGRDKSCDVVIDDGSISRKHTKITFDGKDCYVEDLESRNGTFQNEQRVVQRSRLKNGDVVRVGSKFTCTFLEKEEGAPAPAAPHGGAPGAARKTSLGLLWLLVFLAILAGVAFASKLFFAMLVR